MTVIVQLNGYNSRYETEISESTTVGTLLNNLKSELNVSFIGTPSLQETQTGRVLPESEIVVDDRLYNLNAGIERH